MEDSFRSRVDKVFGSLPGAAPSSNLPASTASTPTSSLWSLTDEEVAAIRWRKVDNDVDDDDDMDSLSSGLLVDRKPRPAPDSSFLHRIEDDLDDLDDDDEKKCGGGGSLDAASLEQKPDDYNDDEWEIRNSIGRDCTLDFEVEEDQYDKVAVGRENSSDRRVYMKDLTKNKYEIDSLSEEVIRKKDPRANHVAAKLRLQEDDEVAANEIDSLKVSDNGSQQQPVSGQNNISQQDSNIKSILKRKDDKLVASNNLSDDSKSIKRVRFDPECKDQSDDTEMGADESTDDDSLVYRLPEDYPSGIPDYMRNPSKYTKYTFDDANVDERSNTQAFMDFLKLIRKSEPEPEDDLGGELPKSVTFVPRKKNTGNDSKNKHENASDKKGGITIAAAADIEIVEAGETCDMDEDEPETEAGKRNGSSGKPGRQYRMKAKLAGD